MLKLAGKITKSVELMNLKFLAQNEQCMKFDSRLKQFFAEMSKIRK
jgi:hypothetical protein